MSAPIFIFSQQFHIVIQKQTLCHELILSSLPVHCTRASSQFQKYTKLFPTSRPPGVQLLLPGISDSSFFARATALFQLTATSTKRLALRIMSISGFPGVTLPSLFTAVSLPSTYHRWELYNCLYGHCQSLL